MHQGLKMAIEAPVSKYRKTNLKIYIAACVVITIWLGYDGYLNKKFIEKNTEDGKPNGTLVFNQKAPPFVAGAAVLLSLYLLTIRNKKLIADENELVLSEKEKISYGSIETIDKTNFKPKGYFVITYKDKNGREMKCRISDKEYGNLEAVLDHLVAQIS